MSASVAVGLETALPRRDVTAAGVAATIVLLVLVMAAFCTVNALKLVGEPFAGFLVNERLAISNVGGYHWSGWQTGLRFPDKLLAVDGRAVASTEELKRIVAAAPVGSSLAYTVQRDGERLNFEIPTMRFGWEDLAMTFGVTFLAGLCYITIGALVFALKINTRVSWVFFTACFFLSIYSIPNFDLVSTQSGFVRVVMLAQAFLPAAFVHFGLLFPRTGNLVIRYPRIQMLPYIVSAVLVLPMLYFYPEPRFVTFWYLILGYLIVGGGAVVLPVLREFMRPKSALARQRAKVVLFGAALALPLPALAYTSQTVLGSFLGMQIRGNLLGIPLLIFPAAIAYSIVKHNLFDVDVYVKRTVGFVIMTAVVATAYFLLQAGLTQFVLGPLFGEAGEAAYPLIFAILVVFLFHPVNAKVQGIVEKVFFRKPFDHKETISIVEKALSGIREPKAMANQILRTIREQMFVDVAGVVILQGGDQTCLPVFYSDEGSETTAPGSQFQIDPSSPLMKLVNRERKLITESDLQEDIRYRTVRKSCSQALAKLGATLAIPMVAHESLVGALFVGHKKSGKFYTRDDVDLLESLSTHGAIAIENARLVDIKSTFSRYLAPAVIEELVAHPEKLKLGGERREVTALFSDIAGFTATSESMTPEDLVHLLNEYFNVTCDVVLRHGATIDKIVGDALHLLFNAPIDQSDHAERAVRCGLELSECSQRLRTEHGVSLGDTRIGINTGFAVVGNFGGEARFDYTAHGDAVNTAARLEGANKYLGTLICVSASAKARCEGIPFRPIGRLILEGKQEAVEVFEPLQPWEASEAQLADYEAAYALMASEAPEARDAFVGLAERFSDDGLIRLHADRLRSGEVGDAVRLPGK